MKRSADGGYRWALTLFPTHAYASEAGMSLSAYEDFYYDACLATDPEPLTAWQRQSDLVRNRLADWINGKEEVHIQAPGTDIKLGVAGRTWIPCVGDRNMPDGEFFTGPVEDSVEGVASFSFPAVYGGREVSGVQLRFEGGKVVDAIGRARRGLPDRDARLRRGRPPPRRARHRHQLRHHHRHQGDPARREDRRQRAHGDRHELPGDGRREQLVGPLGHGVRPARREGRSRSTGSCCRRTGSSSSGCTAVSGGGLSRKNAVWPNPLQRPRRPETRRRLSQPRKLTAVPPTPERSASPLSSIACDRTVQVPRGSRCGTRSVQRRPSVTRGVQVLRLGAALLHEVGAARQPDAAAVADAARHRHAHLHDLAVVLARCPRSGAPCAAGSCRTARRSASSGAGRGRR